VLDLKIILSDYLSGSRNRKIVCKLFFQRH